MSVGQLDAPASAATILAAAAPASRRVLHVSQPHDGGVGRYLDAIVGSHVARGWEVAVASRFDDARRQRLRAVGVGTFNWHAERSPMRGVRREVASLMRIIAAFRPQVIVLHAAKAGLVGRLATRGAVPTVVMPHAWSFAALHRPLDTAGAVWERIAARWTHAVVAVSDGEVVEGLDRRVFAPYFVVPNPVMPGWRSYDDVERQAARRNLGLGGGPLVVCLGRHCRQKGQDELLQAWRGVGSVAPSARLALIGDGPQHAALRAAAPPDVIFTGWVERPQEWVAAADVVVVPSRWEGMSLAMLEAMAAGRSIVTTAVNGCELVRASGGGAVVPVGDVEALGAALADRITGAVDPAAEGRLAAAYVGAHHQLAMAADGLADVLLRVPSFGRSIVTRAS